MSHTDQTQAVPSKSFSALLFHSAVLPNAQSQREVLAAVGRAAEPAEAALPGKKEPVAHYGKAQSLRHLL